MQLDMTVHFVDGSTQDVSAVFSDFVSFERTWNRTVFQFETQARLTDVAWLSWRALTRANRTAVPFEPDWIDSVERIEVHTKDVPDPLVGTAQSDE